MSSRVRQDGLLGRGRTGESERVNETPRNYDRLKFRLLVLSFVYFGERPPFYRSELKLDLPAEEESENTLNEWR